MVCVSFCTDCILILSDKMIKTVQRKMTGVSNMAGQGIKILQKYSVCNLSIPNRSKTNRLEQTQKMVRYLNFLI